ncbi:MAG: hypothetical protein VX479_05750, partial [Verrucomicrobiota bacterium]|nr:hypothetical protein [Verrucomicrobiota bacterium]
MTQLALPLAILLPLGIAAKPQLEEVLGPASGLNSPFGVAFDDRGNAFVAEYEGGRILKLDHSGKLHTLSGNGSKGYAGDGLNAEHGVFHSMHNVAW